MMNSMGSFILRRIIDVGIAGLIFLTFIKAACLSPFLHWWWPLVIVGIWVLLWLAALNWFDCSLGALIRKKMGFFKSLGLSFFLALPIGSLFYWHSFSQPQSLPISIFEMKAQAPTDDEEVLPFFYTLQGLPKSYEDQPIFYQIPYEKGPPERFVSRVIARWKMPETKLVIEGPRTPTLAGLPLKRAELFQCLDRWVWAGHCVNLRETFLERHQADLKEQEYELSSLRWIHVTDNRIKPDEQTQGMFQVAIKPGKKQFRWTAITENDLEQTFILETTAQDTIAESVLLGIISKMRTQKDLFQGRGWIDEVLSKTKIDPKSSLSEIASVQAKLAAKLTVDPKTFETYFHMAALASHLQALALRHKGQITLDWKAVPKPLFEAMLLYGKDVGPNDPKLAQLQGLRLQFK